MGIEIEKAGGNLIAAYMGALDVKPTTKAGYERAFRQFVAFLNEAGRKVETATRADITAYRDCLLRDHKAGTVQAYLTPVRTFYKWTAAAGLYPNITEGVRPPKRSKGFAKDCLTKEQAKEVLGGLQARESLAAARDYALVNLLMRAGLRTVEAQRADVGDLRTVGVKRVLFVQGKGHDDKDEYVVLTPEAAAPLDHYLSMRKGESESAPLFAATGNRNKGGRMTTRSMSRICKEAFREAGIDSDRITAHSLRHTAVTAALLGGATVQEAQAMARHANINTTMIYSHNIDRLNNPAEEKAAAFFD